MNKEEIKKAAEQYEDSLLYNDIKDQCDVKKAFVEGAEWRINSVWKGVNDIPEFGRVILLVMNNVTITAEVNYISTWESLQKSGKKAIWAYIKDITPYNVED